MNSTRSARQSSFDNCQRSASPMKLMKTEDAVGHTLCHDITQFIFRFAGQDSASPPVWWRIPKDRRPASFPGSLASPRGTFCCSTEPGHVHAHFSQNIGLLRRSPFCNPPNRSVIFSFLLTLAVKSVKVSPSHKGDTTMTNTFRFAYGFDYFFFGKGNSDLCCKETPGHARG